MKNSSFNVADANYRALAKILGVSDEVVDIISSIDYVDELLLDEENVIGYSEYDELVNEKNALCLKRSLFEDYSSIRYVLGSSSNNTQSLTIK